jgi:hypothetical protein
MHGVQNFFCGEMTFFIDVVQSGCIWKQARSVKEFLTQWLNELIHPPFCPFKWDKNESVRKFGTFWRDIYINHGIESAVWA